MSIPSMILAGFFINVICEKIQKRLYIHYTCNILWLSEINTFTNKYYQSNSLFK